MKYVIRISLATAFVAALSFCVYAVYKDMSRKPEPPRPVNVNCLDGSRWTNVIVSHSYGSYDLYNEKWVARVPSYACALVAME